MKPTQPVLADLIRNRAYMAECADRTRNHRWNVRRKERYEYEWVRREASPVASRAEEFPSTNVEGAPRAQGTSSAVPAGGAIAQDVSDVGNIDFISDHGSDTSHLWL